MVMTDSVVAWYSSASMKSSREDASPWKSWWSRSCCSGGALGRSWLTTSLLMLGACFKRSLLRICDLIVSSRKTLLCSLQTHAEHSGESTSSTSKRDTPASEDISLTGARKRSGSSLPDSPKEIRTVKHNKKLYFVMMLNGQDQWFSSWLCKILLFLSWEILFEQRISYLKMNKDVFQQIYSILYGQSDGYNRTL